MAKTIMITGASRGFGKLWAEALLQRGDNVVAAVRNLDSLDSLVAKYGERLLPLELDVTDRAASFQAVAKAKAHFGSIDVLINNAGFGLFGAIEESSEAEARAQMETNFFGLLWLTQAVLPIMREQQHGHIIQLSSVLGVVSVPILGIYNASKFAVEGLSETLASEVKGFGINVTLVEPNQFATDWAGTSAKQAESISAYDQVRAGFYSQVTEDSIGIPEATTAGILELIDSKNPPLRLLLGKVGNPWIKQVYQGKLAEWDAWKQTADAAHGK